MISFCFIIITIIITTIVAITFLVSLLAWYYLDFLITLQQLCFPICLETSAFLQLLLDEFMLVLLDELLPVLLDKSLLVFIVLNSIVLLLFLWLFLLYCHYFHANADHCHPLHFLQCYLSSLLLSLSHPFMSVSRGILLLVLDSTISKKARPHMLLWLGLPWVADIVLEKCWIIRVLVFHNTTANMIICILLLPR